MLKTIKTEEKFFDDLQRINIIVGQNNIGKTRRLKAIAIKYDGLYINPCNSICTQDIDKDFTLRFISIIDKSLNFDDLVQGHKISFGLRFLLELSASYYQLLKSSKKILCVDNIGVGLHYLCFNKLWDLLIALGRENGIQIFAATHSQDCLVSLSELARKIDEPITVFRIEKERIVSYKGNQLYTAIQRGIDVR